MKMEMEPTAGEIPRCDLLARMGGGDPPQESESGPMNGAVKLLYPLDEFYAQAGCALPSARPCRREQIPSPYREMLVHSRSMTPTLEAFHQRRTDLRVLACRRDGEALRRQVVLRLVDTGRPVEFAAIVIYLQRF